MSPVSRVPPPRDDPRPRKPRSRPSAMSRSFERRIAVIFRGGQAPRSRASRAAPARRARAVPVRARQKIRRTRAIARRVVRGGRYAARGVVTHATIIIINASWTLVFSSPFLHRPRARETRDAPSTAEARLARRRWVPRVSRAIPRRPPHRHPVADRSHPRAPLPRPRCQLSRPRGSSGVSRRIAIRNPSRAREACLGIFPTHEKEKAGCLLALAELAARRVARRARRGAK